MWLGVGEQQLQPFSTDPDSVGVTPTPTQVSESISAAGSEARLSANWPTEVLQYRKIIIAAATSQGLDPELMAALIYEESWFPPTWERGYELCPDGPCSSSCTSVAGALGPAQVMPFHFTLGENGRDPRTNITRAAEKLREYTGMMGSPRGGLAAYQCGPYTPNWTNPNVCWQYADDVLSTLARHTQ